MKMLKEKIAVIKEVDPIRELLAEVQGKLEQLPNSQTATKRLGVILNSLELWQKTYGPHRRLHAVHRDPDREEIDVTLRAYKEQGYFGLTPRQKEVIAFFDRTYWQNQA